MSNRTNRKPTRDDVRIACGAIACTARIVDGEWQIRRNEAAQDDVYFTDDNQDAIDTAREMRLANPLPTY